jgi:hypothetical protein
MKLPKSKFPWILGGSALFIALCAAFFSVYGISTLFAGAFISTIIMASSLEIGKLVATTFLYRYWSKCRSFLKTYLTIAILVLMLITSLGIFGYLSAAYQKSSIEFTATQERITSIQDQKTYYKDKMDASKRRIDELIKIRTSQESRMSQVLTNENLSRNPLQLKQLQQQTIDLISDTDKTIKDENDKIQSSIDDVRKIDDQINQLKLGTASKKDVQTFRFVADALGVPLDTIARWFILCLIFVFDPLAICLILAYNVAVYRREDISVYDVDKEDVEEQPKIQETPHIESPIPLPPPTPVVPPTPAAIPIVSEASKKEEEKKTDLTDWFKQMFKISS